MDRAELDAWLRLTLTPGVGNDSVRRLLAAFGLPQAIFEQPAVALRQLLTPAQASALAQPPEALPAQLQTTLDWLAAAPDGAARRVITLGDPAYPAALLAIEDRDTARDYKTYLRHNGKPYAWLRAVVSNRPDKRGGRPFFPIKDDVVTLACRIRKRGGDWSRDALAASAAPQLR